MGTEFLTMEEVLEELASLKGEVESLSKEVKTLKEKYVSHITMSELM